MSTQQKNGTTIPTNGTNGKKIETTVSLSVVKKDEPSKVATANAPLEERILRINQLFELQGKYNRLQKSAALLNEFAMKKGEENIELEIKDRNSRQDFTTSNPEVVKDVLLFVRSTHKRKKFDKKESASIL